MQLRYSKTLTEIGGKNRSNIVFLRLIDIIKPLFVSTGAAKLNDDAQPFLPVCLTPAIHAGESSP
jgi:hypothetical protein